MKNKHRLEVLIDPSTRTWLQEFSQATGQSQGQITREAIAKIQLEFNDKTPVA